MSVGFECLVSDSVGLNGRLSLWLGFVRIVDSCCWFGFDGVWIVICEVYVSCPVVMNCSQVLIREIGFQGIADELGVWLVVRVLWFC